MISPMRVSVSKTVELGEVSSSLLSKAQCHSQWRTALICSSKSCSGEGSREHSLELAAWECSSAKVSEGVAAELGGGGMQFSPLTPATTTADRRLP